jgi:mannosyl-3-phosphoglycerate phosphatase
MTHAARPIAADAPDAIVISDVDGTLFDAGGWATTPRELRQVLGVRPLILASSRTIRELVVLQRTLGIRGPIIAENGAVIALDAPARDGTTHPRVIGRRTIHVRRMGLPAEAVRRLIVDAAEMAGIHVVEADQLDPSRRARLGIVTHGDHARALVAREASVLLEPVLLTGSARVRWQSALADRGVTLSVGGRWACAVSGADKGKAARLVRHYLATEWRADVPVIGLGNDANDIPLLEVADHPIVVRRDDGRVHPALRALPRASVCQRAGIGGAVDALRSQLGTSTTSVA